MTLSLNDIAPDFEAATTEGTDNPHGHRLTNAKWITDRQDHITNLKLIAVSQRDGRKVSPRNLQNRHVGGGVLANNPRGVLLFTFAD